MQDYKLQSDTETEMQSDTDTNAWCLLHLLI